MNGLAYTAIHKSILIVEKEENKSGVYKTLLQNNYALYFAESSVSAISLLERVHTIDLLLLVHYLSDQTWIDVLKAFRSKKPTAPAIVVTSYSSEEIAIMALRNGATDYIKTPYSFKELVARINNSFTPFMRERLSSKTTEPVPHYYSIACPGNIRRALDFINENYTSNLNLSQVADISCLSYHHFSKVFKKYLGVGFKVYVNNIRIDKAKQMLLSSDLAVTYIAHSVGFEDLTNFERVFRKLTSYTPSEYRNKIQRDSTSTKKAD
jgi:YesN/AraC family two-component response regulator